MKEGVFRLPKRIQVQGRDFVRREGKEGEGIPMRNLALQIGKPPRTPSFKDEFLRGDQGFICSDFCQGLMSA